MLTRHIALALVCSAALAAQRTTIKRVEIGSAAPSLEGLQWLQGDPVEIAEGRIYVVEFWTPFCPMSREAIPKLNKLQSAYDLDEVVVVSIVPARFERRLANVENFLAEWGGRVEYAVAYDRHDKVSKAWLDGAGLSGYPVAFVVDLDAMVAWIGSPLDEMTQVVERIDAGQFDLKTARKVAEYERDLLRARARRSRAKILDVTNRWLVAEPHRAKPWIARFEVLASNVADADAALSCTREALQNLSDHPHELAQFVNEGLFAASGAAECQRLGLAVCKRAFEADDVDPRLALAYFLALAATQNFDEAAVIAKRATALAEDDPDLLITLARHFVDRRYGDRFARQAITAIQRASKLEPKLVQHDSFEFSVLALVLRADEEAKAVGERILKKAKSDDNFLNEFGWRLVDEASLAGRFNQLALQAAELVHARPNGKYWMYVDTLARCKAVNGFVDEALELQKRAVSDCDDPYYMPQLTARLHQYTLAAMTKRGPRR